MDVRSFKGSYYYASVRFFAGRYYYAFTEKKART